MKRLHPLAVLLAAAGVAGLPAVFIVGISLLQGEVGRIANIAATIIVAGVGWGVANWWRFRYGIVGESLVIERGVLTLERRVVPRARIRGLDLSAPVIHRLLGLRRVTVDAAAEGGKGSELTLAAVSIADAESLERELVGDGPGTRQEEAVASAGLGTLALAGATSPRWIAVPFGVAGAIFGALAGAGEDTITNIWDRLGGDVGGLSETAPLVLAALLIGGLAIVIAIAAGASVVSDGGFRLTTPPGRLMSERGLLRRRQVSIDRARLAALEIREPLSWRPLNLASVRARVTGIGADSGSGAGRTQLHPATGRAAAAGLVGRVFTAAPRDAPGHPRRALPRRLTRAVALPAVAALTLVAAGRPLAAAIAAILVLPAAAIGVDRWRSLATGFNGRLLSVREGSVMRRTTVVDPAAVVEYRLRSSIFQRRAGLCTLELRMGRGAGSARALDIGGAEAARTAVRLDPRLLHTFLTG